MRQLGLGDRISEYVLERELGRGGFGTVYLARHHAFRDRLVAIKLAHDERRARLLREEGLLQDSVRHPNAVEVLGLDADHDPPYLVVAYVEGESLRQRLRREGRLAPAAALAIAVEVLEALAYAHGRGIVHRDLKPENVLLGRDGTARLTDFGLGRVREAERARLEASGGLASRTDSGAWAGTLAYMAPEQIEPGRAVDERADVYAFGILLFEMLAGSRPEGGEVPSERVSGLDPRLDDVFRRCYCRLERRYADAGVVLASVRPLAGGGGGAGGAAPDAVAGLVALEGALAPAEVALRERPTRLGSRASADVRVRGDGVSPDHAEIAFRDGAFTIEDLGSQAGTFLWPARAPNGKRPLDLAERVGTEPLRLAEGVTICLGDPHAPGTARFRFRAGRPAAAPAPGSACAARTTLGPRLAMLGVVLVGLGSALVLLAHGTGLSVALLGLGFALLLVGALVRPRRDERAARSPQGAASPPPAGVPLRAIALLFDLGLLGLALRVTAHRSLLAPLALWLLYDALMTAAVGATAGKWLCGLRVVDGGGRLLRPGRAAARALAKLLAAVPLGLGLVLAAVHRRGAALHDLATGTEVVQTEGFFDE